MYLFAIKSFNVVFCGIMNVVSIFFRNYKVLNLFSWSLYDKKMLAEQFFITSFLLVISIPTSQLYVKHWLKCRTMILMWSKYLWNITKHYLSYFPIKTYIFYNVAYINQICYFHQKCFKHFQHLKLIIDFKLSNMESQII
jgi:hypothetical protein